MGRADLRLPMWLLYNGAAKPDGCALSPMLVMQRALFIWKEVIGLIEASVEAGSGEIVQMTFADWEDLSLYLKLQWPEIVRVEAHSVGGAL